MKVQLIVVQGKPEGKTIPLAGPIFRIGRGETCHLRPNSDQVSREHAEFKIAGDTVVISDLGSRNGTLVNGKAITETTTLKDRDLVQIGLLTFAVSIQGATPAASQSPVAAPAKPATPEDVSHDDIESWLIADSKSSTPERPSGVYGGDTITIAAFKEEKTPKKPEPTPTPAPAPAPVKVPEPEAEAEDADDETYERLPEGEGDSESGFDDENETEEGDEDATAVVDEFIDESNPFYVKKKAPEGPVKPVYKDTSDAANDILRKMMEKRRGSK